MKISFSLTKKFSLLLAVFVVLIVGVLGLLIKSYDEPINFGTQEKLGNRLQRPVEKLFSELAWHRILAQKVALGDKDSQSKLSQIQTAVDEAFVSVGSVYNELIEDLQFTEDGLKKRKREHIQIATVLGEWKSLKEKLSGLKPNEIDDLHSHLISDVRTIITHLGDTSNLILDPDLDSYYLMDITLLALPQAQDRIQSVAIDLVKLAKQEAVTPEDRVRYAVYAAMMKEADIGRIAGDFQTVLNEDPNFYEKSPTLEAKLSPAHSQFVSHYEGLVQVVEKIAKGEAVPLNDGVVAAEKALTSSFDYWKVGVDELDHFLEIRVHSYQSNKQLAILASVLGVLLALSLSWFFIQYLIKAMHEISKTLAHASEKILSASTESANSATQLSEVTTQQAASLQQTMASLEEISAMVSQNADSAAKTHAAVEKNRAVSEDGSNNVAEMLQAIVEIKTTNEDVLSQMVASNKEFNEIVQVINEIGEKTKVINEIVFQTKLLSFNASVEAARAGEHGKGFAVVAEEVGHLAQMSGNAAKEISDMLAKSTQKVNEIVSGTKTKVDQLIEVGKEKIAIGEATVEKCQNALQEISSNAHSISQMIAEIAQASKEQAFGVQEINKAVSQLDDVTQKTSSVAQKGSSQAEQLSSESSLLEGSVQNLLSFIEGKKAA